MAKISTMLINKWRGDATAWLAANTTPPASVDDVKTGRDAWTIAHRSGIWQEAYKDEGVNDAHVQTALEKIFVNAVFRDTKRY